MRRWLALSIVVHVVVVAVASHTSSRGSTRLVVDAPVVTANAPPPPEVIEVQFLADAPSQVVITSNAVSHVSSAAKPARTDVANQIAASPAALAHPAGTEIAANPIVSTEVVRIPSPAIAASSVAMVARQAALGMREQPSAPSTFTVRVEPDGTAHITDRRNLQIAGSTEAAHAREVAADESWLEQHHEHSNAIEMKVPSVGATVATFDITDAAMRWAGQDPYAFEKLKVLDATREQRVLIGTHHREQQIIQTPALVRSNLDDIAKLPAAQRQQTLAELWRDLDHSPAGEVARSTIASYVRDHPIFTDAERALTSAP